jgi:hypothetical protein
MSETRNAAVFKDTQNAERAVPTHKLFPESEPF